MIIIFWLIAFLCENRSVDTWASFLAHEQYYIRDLATNILLELSNIEDESPIQLIAQLNKSTEPEISARIQWILNTMLNRSPRMFLRSRQVLGIEK